jgi:hypothetical protein
MQIIGFAQKLTSSRVSTTPFCLDSQILCRHMHELPYLVYSATTLATTKFQVGELDTRLKPSTQALEEV